jgi:hypothetical protein
LVVSAAFNDEPHPQQPPKSQDAQVVAAAQTCPPPSQPDTLLSPGRSRSRRKQRARPARRVSGEPRKAPPQAL